MKFWLTLILTGLLCLTTVYAAQAQDELNGKFCVIKESRGRIITYTAHRVVRGDRYLNERNQLFEVYRLRGNTAIAKFVRTEALRPRGLAAVKAVLAGIYNLDFLGAQAKPRGPIGIYHTHSDESYAPSDGTSSKRANGGIFQVGDSLTSALERIGVPVVHLKTPHDPHDGMAYDRSRRTAFQILKKQPNVLLDVHRDAIPAQMYQTNVKGARVTKVQLVVGRQNPNFQANNDFAKQIKATVDKKSPGLVKGIFYGKGKFNQDLAPRAMLLEFGSNTNRKEEAEKSASIFAEAAKSAMYGTAGAGFVNRGGWRSLFWILAAAIGGVGIFLLINKRSLKDVGKEFSGAVGETDPIGEPKSESGRHDQNQE